MLTIIFAILMLSIFGRLFFFSLRATWGLAKILITVVLLPLILIGTFIAGLVTIAFPLLILIGIFTVIKTVL